MVCSFCGGLREEAVLGGQYQVDWASRNAPAGRECEGRRHEQRTHEQVNRSNQGRGQILGAEAPHDAYSSTWWRSRVQPVRGGGTKEVPVPLWLNS